MIYSQLFCWRKNQSSIQWFNAKNNRCGGNEKANFCLTSKNGLIWFLLVLPNICLNSSDALIGYRDKYTHTPTTLYRCNPFTISIIVLIFINRNNTISCNESTKFMCHMILTHKPKRQTPTLNFLQIARKESEEMKILFSICVCVCSI